MKLPCESKQITQFRHQYVLVESKVSDITVLVTSVEIAPDGNSSVHEEVKHITLDTTIREILNWAANKTNFPDSIKILCGVKEDAYGNKEGQ